METRIYKSRNTDHVTRNMTFCISILIFSFAFLIPAYAEDEVTTTTEAIPSMEEVIPLIETPTTTDPTPTTTGPVLNTYHVNVNYLNEEIFNQTVSPTSTWFFDNTGNLYSTSTVNALGVLAEASRQGNFQLTIQSGWGYYVSEVAGHAALGFDGWIFNINQQNPGWVAMNDYQIQNNDSLQVFYSVWPWKIESNTSSVYIGENVTFKTLNYASSTWQTSPSTTISINNQLFVTDDSGQYIYMPNATGTFSAFIYGSESWPSNSPTINVEVLEPAPTSTPQQDNPPDNGGGGGNNNDQPLADSIISDANIKTIIDKILAYLKSQQSEDGKIIDGTITDWAIMSFGANGQYADEIKMATTSLLDYEKKYNLDDPSDLNSCATYPRHILALLAAGVEQTDPAIFGLKEKINTVCYKNGLYGLNGINDDVFALLTLSALGTSQSEPIMLDMVSTTLSWQMENGAFSWPDWFNPSAQVAGDDITGAAINALKYAQTKGASIDENIFGKAKNYLKSTQQTDGGWGYGTSDVMTTSWVLMGVNSLSETQNDWIVTSTGKNPWHPLVNNLKADGFYESAWVPGTVDWFAMKHVVPALLGKSWPIIMAPKVTNFSEGATFTYGGGGGNYTPSIIETPTTTPTSTLLTTTTTLQLTTSTIETATTTTTFVVTPIITPTTTPNSDNQTPTDRLQVTRYRIQETKKQNPNPENNLKSSILNLQSESLSSAPTPTPPEPTNPVSSAAKKLFATSSIAAGGLGLYLTWRLLQTLV